MSAAASDLLPGSLAASAAGAAWTWILATLLGAALLEALERGAPTLPAGARLLSWAVAGIPLQAAAWLGLGVAGWLRPGPLVAAATALTVLGAALGGRAVSGALREALDGVAGRARAVLRSPLALASLAALLALLALSLRLALVPTAYYDDLVYHLGLPRQALLTGSWPHLPRFHYSAFPAGWDATYCLPLALGGGSGPQLQNVVGLALLAAATARLARRGGDGAAALAAASVALACPLFASLGALAGNDLFVALALVVGLDRALARRGERPFTTGLVGGAAWAAKYTALPGVAALLLLGASFAEGPAVRRLRAVALAGVGALALAAPWTVRATAMTGNPVHPAFHSALGGRGWSATAAELVARDSAKGAVPQRGAAAFALAAVDLVGRGDRLGFPSGIAPTWLAALAAGLILFARHLRDGWRLLLVAAVAYVGWAATALNQRYAAFLLLALSPFAARLVAAGAHRLRGLRVGELALALALLVATASELARVPGRHALVYGGDPEAMLGARRTELLPRLFASAGAGRDLATRLPADARLLLVGNAFLAFAPRPAIASSAYDDPVVADLLEGAATPVEVTRRTRSLGLTHVLLDRRELARWSERYLFRERLPEGGDALLEAWLGTLEPLGRWGPVLVWRVAG